MQRNVRSIIIDVCDYTNKSLCNLYTSSSDIPGQAHDVFVNTERNGYKELVFNLPSTLPDGESNYRLDFLISDYRIRFLKTKDGEIETDWFLISESKVVHNNKSKNFEIKATHISNLLNTKNLDLEFSDQEGNNTGTIEQIAAAILEGTGWHLGYVAKFYEEEKYGYQNQEKVRSFNASVKTGAFKMMSDLCELFDAKPIYHGEGKYIEDGEEKIGRTVDIIPMNPFSKDLEEGSVPQEVLEGANVLELYYDKNIKGITRTLNTDNIVTRLYAYGSYGDLNGQCSLQTAEHTVLTFSVPEAGEYCFTWQDAKYYFTATEAAEDLRWSTLDFSSRSYVYNGTNLYKVYKRPTGSYTNIDSITEDVDQNYVPYIMDYTYYDSVGLLTDEMLRVVAEHQTTIPSKYVAAAEASAALSEAKTELTKTASAGNGFLKFDIHSSGLENGYLKLTLDKDTYSDGVIFRSDYDETKRNYFTWQTATGIKDSGEAIAGKGSVVYIVRQGSPTTWTKAYVKCVGNENGNYYTDKLNNRYVLNQWASYPSYEEFPVVGNENTVYYAEDTQKQYAYDGEDFQEIAASDYIYGLGYFDEPSSVTLWAPEDTWRDTDQVYMFSSDSIAGLFGPREDAVLSNRKSIEETVKTVTEVHPLYFVTDSDPDPSPDACLASHGWYYRSFTNTFEFGELHFCWGSQGEVDWSNVYVSRNDDNPEKIAVMPAYGYYYSMKRKMLYKADVNHYSPVKGTVDQDRLTAAFASVVNGCINQEVLTKGVKEEYYYDEQTVLPVGNYAFVNEFGNYWLFTTQKVINPVAGDQLRYKYQDKRMWQDNDPEHIIRVMENTFDVLEFPVSNELDDAIFAPGNYENETFTTGENYQISNNIHVHENTVYAFSLPVDSIVVCLNVYNKVTGEFRNSPFTVPSNTTHVRVVSRTLPSSTHYLRVQDYQNKLFSKNKCYTILSCTSTGDRMGLNYLMDQFIDLAHEAYEVKLPALKAAQEDIKNADLLLAETLGDIHREGRWQENNFVEGDERRLYVDALDNLSEVSHPEATYDIDFLDTYGSAPLTEDSEETPWPDIDITYAAHLVDPEIDINKWAYIDRTNVCYDQSWKTTIEVNTRLSMIGQQSFTDVLAKIAEVANETKANQSIYKRAEALTSSGQMAADRLEGTIDASKTYILGGTSNYYTDEKGNFVFESADGESAMLLGGRGWMISQEKDIYGDWIWRSIATGKGLTADSIYTGYLSAERIEAGSITTDKLSASVGQELDISSNVALNLYATVDGTRPAGSLLTQHPNQSDSWIAIAAQQNNDPAYIDVKSGGKVNIYGGSSINVQTDGELNLSGGTANLTSQGKLVVAGGTVDVRSTGTFLVDSTNFKIAKNATTGLYDVIITGGLAAEGNQSKIAGFTLGVVNRGQQNEVNYMYAGQTTSMSSNAKGVYLGDNGINLNGVFKVTDEGYLTSTSGKIADWTINDKRLSSGNGTSYVALSSTDTDYRIWAGAETPADAPFSVKKDGSMTSKSGKIGGWTIGQTTLTGNKTGLSYTTFDNDIAIWAGNATASNANFYVRQDGYMMSKSGQIGGWTIGQTDLHSGSGTNYVALSSSDDTYRIWAGNENGSNAKFSVTKAGYLTSTSGKIGGWVIGDTTLTGNKTGLAKTTADSDIAIWAGNATASSANFYVRQDGYMKSSSGQIGGWTIDTNKLSVGSGSNYVELSTGSTYRIWAGNETASSAPFSVTSAGKLKATDAEITGSITATSGTFTGTVSGSTITGGSINIGSGVFQVGTDGALTATSADITGTINATDGNIGGWTISNTSDVKRLYSGTGTTYVGLDSGSTGMDYAIWVGGNLPTGSNAAPFRVKRDGTLYATKFITISEPDAQHPEGQETEINLSRYPMWKLSYGTIRSVSVTDGYCTSMTFSNSVSGVATVNFKTPAAAYAEGWADAYTQAHISTSNTATDNNYFSVPAPNSTDNPQKNTCTITLTNNGNNIVDLRMSVDGAQSIVIARLQHNKYNSVTISSVEINGSPVASATTVPVIATASNGNTKTASIPITAQRNDAYDKGGATAKVNKSSQTLGYGASVTVTAQYVNHSGTTVNTSSSCTITAPADNKATGWAEAAAAVDMPGSGTSGSMSVVTPGSTYGTSGANVFYVTADNAYAYITNGTSIVARTTHSAYSNGWTGCYNTVGLNSTEELTLPYGGTVTVYANAKASSSASGKTNVASRKINAPADNYNNGWNDCVDACESHTCYWRSAGTYGGSGTTHYVKNGSNYMDVGKNWYTTTQTTLYSRPAKK